MFTIVGLRMQRESSTCNAGESSVVHMCLCNRYVDMINCAPDLSIVSNISR